MLAKLRALSLRDPFVLFLLIGGVIFAGYAAVSAKAATIAVPLTVQRALAEDYELMTGRKPDATARSKLIRDYVADEVLFREAVARGMHMTDKTTRQRLVDRVRFLIAGAPADPSEEQLVNHYAEHTASYRAEPQITLEHVFFEKAPADAPALLATLRGGGRVKGDDFWMGRTLPNYGVSMIRGMFGQQFLRAVQDAPVGTWTGPVTSGRGVHFVRVRDRAPSALLPYPQVREQVRQDYLAAQSGDAVAVEVAKLERNYAIDVEK